MQNINLHMKKFEDFKNQVNVHTDLITEYSKLLKFNQESLWIAQPLCACQDFVLTPEDFINSKWVTYSYKYSYENSIYKHLLNKPCVNGVTLKEQNLSLICCQSFEQKLFNNKLVLESLQIKGLQSYQLSNLEV